MEVLLKQNSDAVLHTLFNILNQNAGNQSIKMGVYSCLCSWIRSGTISTASIHSCSMVQAAFEALQSSDTFEVGSDMLCEIILASSKTPRNMELFHSVLPYLQNLIALLKQNMEDDEVVRGICRIYVEAGESFADLIVSELSTYQAIIEGLLLCSSAEDLDIVRITINAWFMISEELMGSEKSHLRVGFLPVYQSLVGIILQKMQYPEELATFTAQERDEFRDFRHDIGDVLKDCVKVLGQDVALQAPYHLLQSIFQAAQSTPNAPIRWQEVEAPLFSLRTMCREVSFTESQYIPEIMSMLPKLPNHPKIKYAAILVIGRYAQWTNVHPEMLTYQLDFVSKGFEGDSETTIAAAHAFRDLCKYCSKHLVQYIDQLQPFYTNSLPLVQEQDKKEMSEAISHLICAVPLEQLEQAINMFCLPVAHRIHEFVQHNVSEDDVDKLKELNGNS
jgi:transportin-3